jgi:threonine dehydrogenase-like Zn-dependent dehydrogenase
MGEVVFGQGVIGLLVTTLLARLCINEDTFASTFGLVTTFDTLPERLAVSSAMGSSQALFPSEVAAAGPFDVTIEVSGAGAALQAAIDSTLEGGRVVIGSWYGNTAVQLNLGIDFHRSHKTLITSQVSELPAELSATWSKERRFAYTWDLVLQIRPSRLITKKTTLAKAQDAYISLDAGAEIAAVFEY